MTIKRDSTERTKKFRSLTVTLAIAFLALGAITLLISGSLQIYFNFQSQRQVIAGHQQSIARDAAQTVADFIEEKFTMLKTAGRLDYLIDGNSQEQKVALEKEGRLGEFIS